MEFQTVSGKTLWQHVVHAQRVVFPWAGDANGDGVTNDDDIDAFLERLQN